MKTIPCICARLANMASEALVLPVEAHATFFAPTIRACVNAAVMPLSLKLPLGFSPSYCSSSFPSVIPNCLPSRSACWSTVRPSPMVTICSSLR